jgi:O-antigen/teichoic acid export membrane protein
VASIGSERASRSQRLGSWLYFWREDAGALARLRELFAGGSDLSLVRRLAGAAFIIRIVAAVLAFAAQIVLARWLGGVEFGIYVYAWTCLLLVGGIADVGLGSAAQRFIPEYTEHKRFDLLRGYLVGSRALAFAIGTAIAAAAIAAVALTPLAKSDTVLPLILGCAAIPAFALASVQSGIARSYDWINLALAPTYILRQVVLIALMGLAYAAGLPMDAVTTMAACLITLWACTFGQLLFVNRRLDAAVAPGAKAYAPRAWLTTSTPISLVEGFYVLLTYSDVIILTQFRPPEEVAVYYAAAKILALVAFIYFAVAQTAAHKFSEYHVTGDRKRLVDFVAQTVRMTFWPSLALIAVLLALGEPLLSMFGKDFVGGYRLMFIIAIGLLARAAVGPAERLLNMLGERRRCAHVYAGSFLLNVALCFVLIPRFGAVGAAIASATALVFESVWLFVVAKIRLGLHCLVFGRPRPR